MPYDMVFDTLEITSSALYQLCQFFDECIPLHILKHKVWDLNKLDIQKHPTCGLDFERFRTCSGDNVTLALDMIILSIVK